MSRSFLSVVKGSIFREYIGDNSVAKLEDFPIEIINPEIPEFHFILAFAREDYDPNTGKGKGNFRATWNVSNFSAEKIQKLKTDHKNVKVAISIGGRGTKYPFKPEDKLIWIDSAKKSLEEIIAEDYKSDCSCPTKTVIDGIDINYESIESDEDDFVECIGEVVDYLKKKIKGLEVSIAPSHRVLSFYEKLYKEKNYRFDWVNYQFYDQTVSTTDDFVNLHKILTDNSFHVKQLLAGFSTDPNDKGNISIEVFLEGCKHLIATASLPGIFVCDAHHSKTSQYPYYVEKKAQRLLTGSD